MSLSLCFWRNVLISIASIAVGAHMVAALAQGQNEAGSGQVRAVTFDNLQDAVIVGAYVYLDVSPAQNSNPKILWDPVSGNALTSNQIDLTERSLVDLGVDRWVTFPNGNKMEKFVDAISPHCGYAVGISYLYQVAGAAFPTEFYVIGKYSPPKKTSYCDVPLRQEFDALSIYAWGLSDGRLMLVDWMRKIAITLKQPPSSVVDIDDTLLLVPGTMLSDALKADAGDQAARESLLAVIRASPRLFVRSELVSALRRSGDVSPTVRDAAKPSSDCSNAGSPC